MAFVETSALSSDNVDLAFNNLVSEIHRLTKAGKLYDQEKGRDDTQLITNVTTADNSKRKQQSNKSLSGMQKSVILSHLDH